MDNAFGKGFTFQVTDDPTPFTENDTIVSPLNHPVISFNEYEFDKDCALWNVLLTGRLEGVDLRNIEFIHRICLLNDNLLALLAGNYIDDGLYLEGVGRMEINLILKVIKANNPKTEF